MESSPCGPPISLASGKCVLTKYSRSNRCEACHPHIYNTVPILTSVALCWSAFLPSAVHGRARSGRTALWDLHA